MTITYPLTFPTTLALSSFKLGLRESVGRNESPYTFKEQIYDNRGQIWKIEAALPNMMRDTAAEYNAFFLKMRGRFGTFLIGDPNATTPRGTWAGTPLVNGAGQTGYNLIVDGLTAGATVKAGDYFQLGSGLTTRLHKIVTDGVADGGGNLTLEFMPYLRSSPADNAAITFNSAKGLFRLNSNISPFSINSESVYTNSFSALEAL